MIIVSILFLGYIFLIINNIITNKYLYIYMNCKYKYQKYQHKILKFKPDYLLKLNYYKKMVGSFTSINYMYIIL